MENGERKTDTTLGVSISQYIIYIEKTIQVDFCAMLRNTIKKIYINLLTYFNFALKKNCLIHLNFFYTGINITILYILFIIFLALEQKKKKNNISIDSTLEKNWVQAENPVEKIGSNFISLFEWNFFYVWALEKKCMYFIALEKKNGKIKTLLYGH